MFWWLFHIYKLRNNTFKIQNKNHPVLIDWLWYLTVCFFLRWGLIIYGKKWWQHEAKKTIPFKFMGTLLEMVSLLVRWIKKYSRLCKVINSCFFIEYVTLWLNVHPRQMWKRVNFEWPKTRHNNHHWRKQNLAIYCPFLILDNIDHTWKKRENHIQHTDQIISRFVYRNNRSLLESFSLKARLLPLDHTTLN